jgi:predicted dehydrogenase
MSNPLKAGLIGCGSLSQRGVLPHLAQPDARERVELVAVCDTVEARVKETAEQYGVSRAYTAPEALINDPEVELVLVITPIPYHFPNALAAIEAGKHVYVQKAMTTSLAEAEALLVARDKAGVKLAAAPGYELFPSTGQMRQLVQEGVLGRVCVAYTYTMGFGHEYEQIRLGKGALAEIDPTWYYRPGAGPLPDVTIYSLQLVTSVLGPVRRVTALANKAASQRVWQDKPITVEVDDNNLVLMEFVSGALAVAVGSNCRGSQRIPWGGLGLYGTDGVLEITEVNNASGYPTAFEVQGGRWNGESRRGSQTFTVDMTAQPYLSGAHLEIEEPHVYVDIMELAEAIREGRTPRATGEQALHVVEIIEKSLLAARTGQTQVLSSSF